MATIFDSLTALPCSWTAGEVVTWIEELPDYPGATHSVAYKFSGQTPLDGFQQFAIAGTESSTATYTFATPSAPKPGVYTWEKQITLTAGSVMRVAACGRVTVKPNAATALTTTFAAAQVALLETALAALNTSTNQSVSFNGQSYSKANLTDYNRQLAYWQARVIAEKRALAALDCPPPSAGRIVTQFVQS